MTLIKGNKALASHLGVTDVTICNWKRAGRLRYNQIGATIFYDTENLFAERKINNPRKK
ncbi:hypothetical protein [Dysgonomonas macrotermitis]|uniref:Helix-turn-helix domain-containing protein n=1 Tax=Dysgonomonas macrotermitis TaxID=1346286 RepID=A0A1M4SDQ8_9BACT|nr:hypothetical protein [Dysgonomonas macrotermitis]SHE30349.1 hypothetical protein SAMN05444362_10133 [Dysgonomonas macrotermitis]